MVAYVPDPFLTPAQIVNELGTVAAEVYARLEERLIARVQQVVDPSADLLARQRALQQLRQVAEEELRRLSPTMGQDFVQIAAERGVQAALDAVRTLPGFPPDSLLQAHSARAMEALALDLTNRLDALNQRILRFPQDAYQRIIAGQTPTLLSGVDTLTKVQRAASTRFLANGIGGFTDRGGRVWNIGTYAEMATRTAALRAWTDASVHAMQLAGVELVSVVVGNDACEPCARWSGKVLSTGALSAGVYELPHATQDHLVRVKVDGTLDQARDDGWQHPNCRCAVAAFLPGLHVVGGSTVYDPVMEQEREDLRALERKVRATKRKIAATTDPEERAALGKKLRDQQATIRQHIRDTGLMRAPYREQLWFTDGRPPTGTTPPTVRGTAREPQRRTAERLSAAGHSVTLTTRTPGVRSPDAYIDGALWEVKTLHGDGSTLSRHMRDASTRTRRTVVDVTDTTLPLGTALDRTLTAADRLGVAEVILVHSGGLYQLMDGEWRRR